jgi:hypothetical protein
MWRSIIIRAAMEIATGMVKVGHYPHRRRREFLDFMNGVLDNYPETELHVVLDNLNTHKPKHDRWLAKHPNVHFHYTPTHRICYTTFVFFQISTDYRYSLGTIHKDYWNTNCFLKKPEGQSSTCRARG